MKPEQLRAFLRDMDRWIREGDVMRRQTLLREFYQEIRIWPKRAMKPWNPQGVRHRHFGHAIRFWVVLHAGGQVV